MGNCIICGTDTDGPICDVHQEDVLFEFTGNRPSQLTPGRFYRGTVDGYADFGVFVDIGNVTGLLHRSKIDRRLESLEWEPGDDVVVQVNNVRDNGDIDLGWSIRQTPAEFRGVLIDAPDGDYLPDEDEESADGDNGGVEGNGSGSVEPERVDSERPTEPAADQQPNDDAIDEERSEPSTVEATPRGGTSEARRGGSTEASTAVDETETDREGTDTEPAGGDAAEVERVSVDSLGGRVGEDVRLEGVVASVRQTSGPTVFELRDETGMVDCAAFVEAGVRAYPDVETDDVVRLDGDVRLRRDEIQVETESLVVLEGDEREAVEARMAAALDDRATPASAAPLTDDEALAAVADDVADVAAEIRRAVLESRPVVVRHDATTDGYVAGAAIERAVLPLVEDEHASADAVYHYFDRRPLEDGVYDMNDATKDATRMLGDRERHDEKLPLFVFAAAGSTAASMDGLELLDVYGAPRVVLDGRPVDAAVVDEIDSLVTVDDRTAATVAATVAAAVNEDVREDLLHLPAVSFWEDAPAEYVSLAEEAGVDAETARELREALALEAYYQSYEDKRELVIDLLFETRTGLAAQVSEQFRTKLQAELDTATPNLDEREVEGTTLAVLDTDSYTHRYDFPPTRLLLDELHRRLDADVVVGVGTDELHLRSDAEVDLESLVDGLREAVPTAGVSDPGAREPKLTFLAGEREAVVDALVDGVATQVVAASAQ